MAEFEHRTQALWDEVNKTDFPFRSKLLAAEVERTRPDLIGLQEVALWRRGPDGLKDGLATPATRVKYDFLALLRRALKRRGLQYRVGVRQQETDIEAPIEDCFDVRLTIRDVILVRKRLDCESWGGRAPTTRPRSPLRCQPRPQPLPDRSPASGAGPPSTGSWPGSPSAS